MRRYLLAAFLLVSSAMAQAPPTPSIDAIRVTDADGTLINTIGGAFTLKCASGLPCNWSGPTLTVGGAGSIDLTNSKYTQSDYGAKMNAAIADIGTSGGTIDARGVTGTINYTTDIVFTKSNIQVLLAEGAKWRYCGTGNGWLIATDSLAALPVQNISIIGGNVVSTELGITTGCGSTAASVLTTKWTSHNLFQNLSILAIGQTAATTAWYEFQTVDTTAYNVLVYGTIGGDAAGTSACRFTGNGFGHFYRLTCAGGHNGLIIEPTTAVVPPAIVTLFGLSANDGTYNWHHNFTNLQVFGAYADGLLLQCNGASVQVAFNKFFGVLATLNGRNDTGGNNENGITLSCSSVTGTEAIVSNDFYGITSRINLRHGVMFHGYVLANTIKGLNTDSNGISSTSTAYGLWLRNGTAVAPVLNLIEGNLAIPTAVATNRALVTDSSTALNKLDVWTGGYTNSIAGTNAIRRTNGSTVTEISPVFTGASSDIYTSTQATGTAPLTVASTTKVTNLNSDTLDGTDWTAPGAIGGVTPAAGSFTTVGASGQITSTVTTGTAPLVIASTTNVANLNASALGGATFAAPGAIGGGTPAAGSFTTLGGSTSLTVGSGTAITKHLSATATLDFANLAAIGCEDLTITVTGAALGDSVEIGVPNASIVSNGSFFGWVSATNTVSIRFCTVVSGDPASGTFRADVTQH